MKVQLVRFFACSNTWLDTVLRLLKKKKKKEKKKKNPQKNTIVSNVMRLEVHLFK